MVHFVYPYLFWIFIIPFAIFALLVATNKSKLERLFEENVLARLRADKDSIPQVVRNILFFTALFLMIVAMARPIVDRGERKISLQGLDVVMALDISGSMRSTDNYPNRLSFAKQKAKLLLQNMSNDEVALVTFADNAFLVAPFTNDIIALQDMLDGISDASTTMGATNFTALGEMIVSLSKDKPNKIAIVFSDGGDEEALGDFESLLSKNDIKLFVVLVGSKNGSAVLDINSKPLMLPNGKIAMTKRNDALANIALEQNGAYVIASYDSKDVQGLADTLHQSGSHKSSTVMRDWQELFYYPLSMSLIFLLFAWSSLPSRIKR